MKHLLKLSDLTSDEIFSLLDLADKLKYEKKHGIPHPILAGKTLGMIFQKSSTRTRVSFECGMYQLGGSALFLSSRDLQIGRGEPVEDTARVLSRYLDGIMIRTFEQAEVEALAEYGTIPVINGLTDYCHPCQVLADLQTVREHKGTTEGKKLCFIGDGNNMANSLIVGGIKTGMSVSVACPDSHRPDPGIMKWAADIMPDKYSKSSYAENASKLGIVREDSPSSINIYAISFEAKEAISDIIDKYNASVKNESDKITYTDYVALMMSSVTTIINAISYVLIAFVAISLVVSSIMIGIITYISVLERTKEIGILRSIGASKRDISRVFNAEAVILGFTAGVIGILVTVLLTIPINAIIRALSGISGISAALPPVAAVVLVLISMFLTFIAGLIPSRIAAKKDPVVALRTE